MLGREAANLFAARGHQVISLTRAQLDVTESEKVKEAVRAHQPDLILHCAAFTQVDRAEREPDSAFAVNALGTAHVASAAGDVGAKLCYISTDYVFEGNAARAYTENEAPNPVNVYGRTKLAGEEQALLHAPRHFIVRTAWLFGAHGSNFVRAVLRQAREKGFVKAVADQTGSPTYAADLADALEKLTQTEKYGIYHIVNSGACTRYELAAAALELSGIPAELRPCASGEFPGAAPRPCCSALDAAAWRAAGFAPLPGWRDALARYLGEIGELRTGR